MSLTSALNTAQSIFNNTGTQSSVVSNNISNSSNSDYVRRQAMISTSLNGAQVVKISRAQEDALMRQWLKASTQDSGQQTLLSGLTDLKSILGGNDYETAPATYLSVFQQKLQAFRTSPSSTIAAQGAITAAQDVANSLNNASKSIQVVRQGADKEIATQVATLNTLLAQFKTANDAVKSGLRVAMFQPMRWMNATRLLKQISSIVGVNAVDRNNGDMALYTADGTVVFDTIPRKVTFASQDTYTAQTQGNGVYIDGVSLTGGKGSTRRPRVVCRRCCRYATKSRRPCSRSSTKSPSRWSRCFRKLAERRSRQIPGCSSGRPPAVRLAGRRRRRPVSSTGSQRRSL
jgi:flagellar hook-associated protein 1 FlgK